MDLAIEPLSPISREEYHSLMLNYLERIPEGIRPALLFVLPNYEPVTDMGSQWLKYWVIDEIALSSKFIVIPLEGRMAKRDKVYDLLKTGKVQMWTGVMHGYYFFIVGQDSETLLHTAWKDLLKIASNGVYHARLSCLSGRDLSPATARNGSPADKAYKDTFIFMVRNPRDPVNDPLIPVFFKPWKKYIDILLSGGTPEDAKKGEIDLWDEHYKKSLSPAVKANIMHDKNAVVMYGQALDKGFELPPVEEVKISVHYSVVNKDNHWEVSLTFYVTDKDGKPLEGVSSLKFAKEDDYSRKLSRVKNGVTHFIVKSQTRFKNELRFTFWGYVSEDGKIYPTTQLRFKIDWDNPPMPPPPEGKREVDIIFAPPKIKVDGNKAYLVQDFEVKGEDGEPVSGLVKIFWAGHISTVKVVNGKGSFGTILARPVVGSNEVNITYLFVGDENYKSKREIETYRIDGYISSEGLIALGILALFSLLLLL